MSNLCKFVFRVFVVLVASMKARAFSTQSERDAVDVKRHTRESQNRVAHVISLMTRACARVDGAAMGGTWIVYVNVSERDCSGELSLARGRFDDDGLAVHVARCSGRAAGSVRGANV